MARSSMILLAVAAAMITVPHRVQAAERGNLPSSRIAVIYFHRTQRCPTCLKMGGYSEEAVKQAFAKQLKDGTVKFYLIDFQDPRNAKLAKGYHIKGPALVVARVENNKTVRYKNLEKIWEKVADKNAFMEYVRENVNAYYQNLNKPVAELPKEKK